MIIDIATSRSELRIHLGLDPASVDDLPDADADLLLNRSLWGLMNAFNFRETELTKTFVTVIGTRLYSVPSPFEALRLVWVEDDQTHQHTTLDRATPWEYENTFVNTADATNYAKPLKYVRENNMLRLWPTPDKVYNMGFKYWVTLDDLSDTNPNWPLPNNWWEILLQGAIWRGWIRLKNYTDSVAARNIQINMISSVVPTEAREEVDSHNAGVSIKGYTPDSSIYGSKYEIPGH